MSRLLCCLRARRTDMGAALSHQEGDGCDGVVPVAPPTMADVIRERKKKAGGAGLGTLRRRIANATRRPRDQRPDRGCEHARFIRGVVSSWRLAEVFLLCEELEAGAAIRDLATRADLAREPAPALHTQLSATRADRWWCDVELCGGGGGAGSWSVCAHRCILAARSAYFRDLLQRYPPSCVRVPLEGLCASMSRAECEACVSALYAGTTPRTRAHSHHTHAHAHPHAHSQHKYETGSGAVEADLDIINVDNCRTNGCTCTGGGGGGGGGVSPRVVTALAITQDPLHTSMHYLLDSGEMADTRLVFRLEGGCGAAYGFRTALELPCHRVVLAARSRFFKSMMSGRAGSSGAVCVDEQVLPRRYARALLHAAYTDQVDLSLIGRNTSSPPSTTSGTTSAWAGAVRGGGGGGGGRGAPAALLDDAFQLYEIARFLEMPIVVQGCEDAIVEALSPESLPLVLRWAAQAHASHWVHRQAMRYFRDEFTVIMNHSGAGRIPRAALAAALASDHLQASETQALRALLRWSGEQTPRAEPNVVWHTAHSVSRRGARRRSGAGGAGGGEAALRETLAALVPLVRTEHLPHDSDLLHQLVRRGLAPCPPPAAAEEGGGGGAHAWLGRGSYRPARCFIPYLDEIKALLEDQPVPEAEVARARRARYLHRIPDTLYMVAAARNPESVCASPPGVAGGAGGAASWVSARTARALRARVRELRAAPPAHAALAHPHHAHHTHKQIALRAVRELGLPDACADALLQPHDTDTDSEHTGSEWEGGAEAEADADADAEAEAEARADSGRESSAEPQWSRDDTCCRTISSNGSVVCATGSLRAAPSLHIPLDMSRSGTAVRRDTRHRRSSGEWSVRAGPVGSVGSVGARARLSAAVPDVAMAPNANTHLLTQRDYFRHPPPWEYGGVVLQLDLGDGATHTPRPGSRAQRNSAAQSSRSRDQAQAMSCVRARSDAEELRAAIELSVMRAYSSFHGGGAVGAVGAGGAAGVTSQGGAGRATLPHYRADLPQPPGVGGSGSRLSELVAPSAPAQPPIPSVVRHSPLASPSPRRRRDYSLYRPQPHDYRCEASYGGGGGGGGSGSASRGHSPSDYA